MEQILEGVSFFSKHADILHDELMLILSNSGIVGLRTRLV